MYAHSVARHTGKVRSQPVLAISTLQARSSSTDSSISTSPTSATSMDNGVLRPMSLPNDSEATLLNDIVALRLAKESKGDDDFSSTLRLPGMEAYLEIAQSNPFVDVHPAFRPSNPEVPSRSTSLSSSRSTLSPSPSLRASATKDAHTFSSKRHSTFSFEGEGFSITSRNGPKDRYSVRHVLEQDRISLMIDQLTQMNM